MHFKNESAVTTDYVTSALRQQMVVAGCLLQDNADDSTYVVEARVGALGTDSHEINYGIPPSNAVNAAASLVTRSPLLPSLPEISLARKTEDMAAAKICAFAYHKETRMPVWQSGTSLARSEATGTWIMGAGPFQRGSIYGGTQFAGNRLRAPGMARKSDHSGLLDSEFADRDTAIFVYRGTAIWDGKLRQKVEDGDHLIPPQFDGPAVEEELAETEDGKLLR